MLSLYRNLSTGKQYPLELYYRRYKITDKMSIIAWIFIWTGTRRNKHFCAHSVSECAFFIVPAERRAMKIGIIGGGKVGLCLGGYFNRLNMLVFVRGSDEAKSQVLAEKFDLEVFSLAESIRQADVIFLTVPDRKISAVAEELSALGPEVLKEKTFLHCSGSLDLEVLQALAEQGSMTGSMHPLQSFADEHTKLQGVYMAVDGAENVRGMVMELVKILGGTGFFVPAEDRKLYHCAACICSNYVVTLECMARNIMRRWTGTDEAAWQALLPLFNGTAANLNKTGALEQALTGPIARGDAQTVAGHLQKIPAEYIPVYSSVGLLTAQIALTNGTIDEDTLKNLEKILGRPEDK